MLREKNRSEQIEELGYIRPPWELYLKVWISISSSFTSFQFYFSPKMEKEKEA
jgi:hypothetical protein